MTHNMKEMTKTQSGRDLVEVMTISGQVTETQTLKRTSK